MQKIPTLFLGLAVLALAFAPTASAHKTDYAADGTIKVVWGLLHEPAVTWRVTGLDLRLTDNASGEGIALDKLDLEASLTYGDQTLPLDLSQRHGQPDGHLTSQPFTPTRAGLYALHLKGTIDGKEVDVTIPAAHEIAAASETYFPEPSFDPYSARGGGDASAQIAALEARIAALEAQADTQATTPATVTPQDGSNPTPALGLLGAIAAVAAVLAIRRRA